MPTAKLFGPDGMAVEELTGQIPADVQAQTYLTGDADERPAAGQKSTRTTTRPRTARSSWDIAPYAVLLATRRCWTCSTRSPRAATTEAVIDVFLATKKTDSVFGPYSIRKDGDTTLTTYAKGGKMVFFHHSIKEPLPLRNRLATVAGGRVSKLPATGELMEAATAAARPRRCAGDAIGRRLEIWSSLSCS